MRIAPVLIIALLTAACGRGRESDTFVWRERMPAGGVLTVYNTYGPIHVTAADGPEVEVRATKHYKGFRPQRVRFVTETSPHGALVCAMWGRGGECSEDKYRSRASYWARLLTLRSEVSVSFAVAVPRGVRVSVQTVNGSLKVDGAGAPVKARTVNGSISVATSAGPVTASTVNGSIVARVDSFATGGPMALTTVNGSVTAELPPELNATIEAATVNGRIQADYPVATTGPATPHRLHGTVGAGGREIKITTVNGRVAVRARGGAGGEGDDGTN